MFRPFVLYNNSNEWWDGGQSSESQDVVWRVLVSLHWAVMHALCSDISQLYTLWWLIQTVSVKWLKDETVIYEYFRHEGSTLHHRLVSTTPLKKSISIFFPSLFLRFSVFLKKNRQTGFNWSRLGPSGNFFFSVKCEMRCSGKRKRGTIEKIFNCANMTAVTVQWNCLQIPIPGSMIWPEI